MAWSKPRRYEFEGPEPKLGPGVSRPLPKQPTRNYHLQVKLPNAPALRITIPAPSKAKALMYCRNRWPECEAEVLR
jgi:hypothetical protein